MKATPAPRRIEVPATTAVDDPSPIRVAFDAPAAWQHGPLPRPVAIMREPAAGRAFRANVVVTVDRAGPLLRAEAAAALTLRETRRHASAVGVIGERSLLVDGRPAAVREQILVGRDAAPLLQCVATVVLDGPGGRTRDCVQFTITAPLGRAREAQGLFTDLLRSVKFKSAGRDG